MDFPLVCLVKNICHPFGGSLGSHHHKRACLVPARVFHIHTTGFGALVCRQPVVFRTRPDRVRTPVHHGRRPSCGRGRPFSFATPFLWTCCSQSPVSSYAYMPRCRLCWVSGMCRLWCNYFVLGVEWQHLERLSGNRHKLLSTFLPVDTTPGTACNSTCSLQMVVCGVTPHSPPLTLEEDRQASELAGTTTPGL